MKILKAENWKAFGKELGVASADFLKARSSEAMKATLTEWMDSSPAKDVTWERVLEATKKHNLATENKAIEDHLQTLLVIDVSLFPYSVLIMLYLFLAITETMKIYCCSLQ